MITTVTLNPAIDKTVTVENFKASRVNRITSIQENLGGKGINVTKVLIHLGSISTALGFIGQKNLNLIMNFMTQERFTTNFILVDALTRTNTKIIDPISKDTTDINEPGFSVNETHIQQMRDRIAFFSEQSSFMVFSGSVCQGINPEAFTDLVKSVKETCKVVLDADGDILLAGLKASPFLIKPNIHELEKLVGQSLVTHQAIIQACQHLIHKYHVRYIIVSMGEHGSLLVSKDETLKASALTVEVVSTVGAGDSMLAGFLHQYEKTLDLKQALQYATCTGSLAVTGISTDALKQHSIEYYLSKIDVTSI